MTQHARVADFTIVKTSCVDSDGRLVGDLHPAVIEDRAQLARLYEAMVLTRTFDAKAVALQRTGRLGTFASSLGQEAVSVGAAAAMRPADVLVPSFREQGAQLWRGVTVHELLLYWGGDRRGSDFAVPREDFPISVPIGTHVPHAVGVGLAMQLKQQERVAVCVLGDGATSRGDVAAAMNFAGVRAIPVVFVVNDNQWAISLPRSGQTAADTLAQKALAAGFPGRQVDGNDVVAVSTVVSEAIESARRGDGPQLIEALTYRLADHTTADDAGRYRSDEEVSERWPEEPVTRIRQLLTNLHDWDKADEEAMRARCNAAVDAGVEAYLATEPMEPSSMFEHLHAELPTAIEWQAHEVGGRG